MLHTDHPLRKSIRLPAEIHADLVTIAKGEDRTIIATIRQLIRMYRELNKPAHQASLNIPSSLDG